MGDKDAHIIQTALFLQKLILLEQKPFDGHFYTECLKTPVPEAVPVFMNVVLQGSVCIGQVDTNLEEANLN